jgi:hypothetical protein
VATRCWGVRISMRDLDSSWIHCWFAMMVPAVIAAGGIWFNRQQRQRELEIAEQRAQDEALQAYLEQMSQMLTDKERTLRRGLVWHRLGRVDSRRRADAPRPVVGTPRVCRRLTETLNHGS